MLRYPAQGCCPICHWFEYRPVTVRTANGFRETELLQCGGCSAVFRSAAQFAKAMELRLIANASAVLAELAKEPTKSDGDLHKTWWIDSSERPLSSRDVGRFVVGTGYAGWNGGLVTEHGDGLCISSGGRQPLAANALHLYLLLDPPPTLSRPR